MLVSSVWRGGSRRFFIVGLLLGGLISGSLLLIVGSLTLHWWVPADAVLWGAATVCLAAVLQDAGVLRLRLPQNARQVPELISSSGPRRGALQFGVEMGTGARTYMTSMLPFVPVSLVLLGAPWLTALGIGAAFGLGRSAVPAVRALKENDDRWSASFGRHERWIQVTLDVAVLGCLIALAVQAFR
ncbi:hypothetical protein [Nocardioides soli]|uniref:Uncharacterized protein n=1 Tax=Nocardioides soli TaxID=1036020 RepID=A0A7W4YZ69_9ACTN|nr:hypothetical protein [Nocardioides soli]MBB3040834.1 hypothetical protein [Nocardioides soli]